MIRKLMRQLALVLAMACALATPVLAQNTTLTQELNTRGVKAMTSANIDAAGGDPTARAVARTAAARGAGNTLIRIVGGRIFNAKAVADSTYATYETLIATSQPCDAVQAIIAMGNTSSSNAVTPTAIMRGASVASSSDADVQAVTPVAMGVAANGGAIFTLPPSSGPATRNWVITDWAYIPSIPRTDSFAGALYAFRISMYLQTGAGTGNVVVMGNGSQSFANWAAHPSGRIFRFISKLGVTAGNWSGMTLANSAIANGSPVVGIRCMARGKVVNIFGGGDSITEGQGDNSDGTPAGSYIGEGFGFPAAVTLSNNTAGVTYEWSDIAWSGQAMSAIKDNVIATLNAGLIPQILVVPAGSPNEVPGSPAATITQTIIDAQRGKLGELLFNIQQKGVEPIVWTWLPTNVSVKAFGATDVLRRNYNADIRTWATRGATIADFDSVIAGVTDTNGQVQMKVGTVSDGIHPNNAGNALMSPLLVRAIQRISAPVTGQLISANDNTALARAA